ncbi:MAG: major capsid protein [Selenomonadaceae bacterium]|nr:major capsid protein [Selenomonadaceae bacterium]MBR4384113.1 major capsid protein [Selenomonadaceae bacterium]
MQNPWLITDQFQLLQTVERIKPPASYLVDTWFPNQITSTLTNGYMAVEYRKEGRLLAPFVSKGGRGVNVNRGSSRIRLYKAPMVGPRRVIGLGDIELRQFGEQPVFSNVTPEQRAAKMQAEDMMDLLRMVQNSKSKMAADIIQTGKTIIRGLADDGVTEEVDEITFDWNSKVNASTDWANSTADIYGDIKAVSERIQEDSGFIPTLMLCGKNVEKKLLNNSAIYKWLQIPNRENLAMASFSPHYTSPQARFIGYLSALNIEIISYAETYTDTDGKVKPFLDPDVAIIGVPGVGRQLYGSVTCMNQAGDWQTFVANNVPVYHADYLAQQSSLTIFSRFLLVPETMADWAVINTGASSTSGDASDGDPLTNDDVDNIFKP